MTPVEFRGDLWLQKARVPGLSCGVVCVILRLAVLVEHRLVADGQTERHRAMASPAHAYHRAVKNALLLLLPMFIAVSGGWGAWAEWSTCSASCGDDGRRTRRRRCDSPSPAHGGQLCRGDDMHTDRCHQEPCPGASPTGCSNVTVS